MAEPFLVLGLPRSRTNWLACFMSCGFSECMHDGLRYYRTFNGLIKHLRGSKALYAGDSDSGLLLHWREILDSGIPTLFVHRPIEESERALFRAFGLHMSPDVVKAYKAARYGLRDHARHVDFDVLNERTVMESVWGHLMPQAPWSSVRWRLFRQTKIEAHAPIYMEEVAACLG